MPIMPSMAAGSDMGFAGGWPILSGFFKNAPDWNAEIIYVFRARKDVGEMLLAFVRRLMPRSRDRCSLMVGRSCFFGVEAIKTVA